MAELAHDDLVEQILIRLDVKDLIRFKSVCKSWHSLITSPGFISRHQNSSYNEYNNIYGYTSQRIVLSANGHKLVGSSNGLVCIISISEFSCNVLVCNPSTREVRQLRPYSLLISSPLLCWGFGYDSSRDDYTVFVGAGKGENQTCFHVLSLKSNVWRVIGEVKYKYGWWFNRDGVLCNGALHWIVTDEENEKDIIIAYDLSKEEFREIPQPDDPRYECTFRSYLGMVKECLCIYRRPWYSRDVPDIWLMKKYNVKESWEPLPHDREINYEYVHGEINYEYVHLLTALREDDDYILHQLTTPREDEDYILPQTSCFTIHVGWDYISTPIFVPSLVSPHSNRSAKVGSIYYLFPIFFFIDLPSLLISYYPCILPSLTFLLGMSLIPQPLIKEPNA
ncbi:putative F-box domain, galactose oxidase/kelch, beta-propeller, F-box associated interaction [Helianthus annuus]|nr:putative F-box domain, galactose oxidase/kelch, beta-propeller, F-box associated interaction [Helianthus annuus]